MNRVGIIPLLLCLGCVALPPSPAIRTAQSRAGIIATQPNVVLVPDPFHIVYSPYFDPSNYVWSVESSTDLVTWQAENFTQTNTEIYVNRAGRPNLDLRLRGTQ
jgi:hypothetical protein